MKKIVSVLAGVCAGVSLLGANAATLSWNPTMSVTGIVDGAGTWDDVTTNWFDGAANVLWSDANPDSAIFGAANGAAGTVSNISARTVGSLTFNAPGSGYYLLSGGALAIGSGGILVSGVATSATPPLDSVSNSVIAAFSLRRLSSSYAGAAISVQRTSDSTTQDVAFTAGGDLDTAALLAFTGASDGIVLKVYPQAGTATMVRARGNPKIVIAGAIQTWPNGRPRIVQTASDSLRTSGLTNIFGGGGATLCAAISKDNTSAGRTITGTLGNWLVFHWNTGETDMYFNGNPNYLPTGNVTTGLKTWAFAADAGSMQEYRNGVQVATFNTPSVASPGDLDMAGVAGTINEPSSASFGELIIFGTKLSSADLAAVQNGEGFYYTTQSNALAPQIASAISLGAAQSWTVAGNAALAVGGSVTNSGNLLSVTNEGYVSVSGAISGAGGLNKTGSGTLTLTGANTYNGGSTVGGGSLQIGNGTVNGTVNGAYAISNGATLTLNYNSAGSVAPTWTNFSGAGTLDLKSAKNFDTAWGQGGLTASFTGTLEIDGGRVYCSGSGNQGLGSATTVVVTPGGHLGMWQGGSFTQNFIIAGTGYGEGGYESALRLANNAITTTVFGNVNLSANATIAATGNGIINGVVSGGGAASLTLGTANQAGTVMLANNNNNVPGGVTVGYGTLILSGTNNAIGPIAINGSGRTLSVLAGGSVTCGVVNIGTSAGATLNVAGTLTTPSLSAGWSPTITVPGTLNAGAVSFSVGATLPLSGTGTVTATSFRLANSTTVSDSVALLTNSGTFFLGDASAQAGTFSQTAGTVTLSTTGADNIRIGHWATESSAYNLSGGIWNALGSDTVVGWDGNGTIAVSGGTANLNGIRMGNTASAGNHNGNGTIALTGGALNLGADGLSAGGAGAHTITLGAGTVGALATWSSSLAMLLANATTFDTSGGNISLNGVLSSTGGLTKSGSGMLSLGAANTYGGSTIINNGALQLGPTGSISNSTVILVGAAGTLDVSPIIGSYGLASFQTLEGYGTVTGSVTSADGAKIIPGVIGAAGTLAFKNDLALSSGTTNLFDLGLFSGDVVAVAGNLAGNNGTVAINEMGAPTNSSYLLFTYGGSLTSNFNPTVAGNTTRRTWTLNQSVANQITLDVTGSGSNLLWRGYVNTNWDLTSANWLNGAVQDIYFDGDNVTFDNVGAASGTVVNLSSTLLPASVTVNSSSNYVFGGSGSIAGSATLTKSGTGTLTLSGSSANTYAGVTTLTNGYIVLSKSANTVAVSGNFSFSGAVGQQTVSTLSNNQFGATTVFNFDGSGNYPRFMLENTTQMVAGINNTSGNGVIESYEAGLGAPAAGGTCMLVLNGSGGYGYNGYLRSLGGTLGLTMNGSGTQTLSGAQISYTGGTTINAGLLNFAVVNDGIGGGMVLNGGALKQGGAGYLTVAGLLNVAVDSTISVTNSGASNQLFFDGGVTGSGNLTITNTGATAVGVHFRNGTPGLYSGNLTVNGGHIASQGNGFNFQNSNVTLNNANWYMDGSQFATTGANEQIGSLNGSGNLLAGIYALTLGTFNKSGSFGGVISGSGTMTKTGTGTQILTGTNTFGGATTVSAGVLQLGNANALTNSTVTISVNNGLAFSSGIGSFTLGGLAGANNLSLTDTGSTPVTLNVGGNGASTTYSGVMSGGGNLVKSGSGALTLANSGNTFSGGTAVSAGTLLVNGTAGTGAVTVASGATLGGTGFVNGEVSSSGIVAPGVNAAGRLTLSQGYTQAAGASLNIELGGTVLGTNYDLLVVSNTAALDGALNVSTINGYIPAAGTNTYTILTAGTVSGTFATTNLVAPPGYALGVQYTSTSVVLTVVGTATVFVWQPATNANWDLVSSNWFDGVSTTGLYFPGSVVLFDDTGAYSNNVNLSLALSPVSVTVNSASNYTFSGAGYLSGVMPLTKMGTGALTVSTTNTYSGLTTINNGTLTLGGSGTMAGPATVNAGTLAVTGSATLGGGTYAANITNNGSFVHSSTVAQTMNGFISGTGTVTKTGANYLYLGANNPFTGSFNILGGQVQQNVGTTFSAGAAITVSNAYLRIRYGAYGINELNAGSLTLAGGATLQAAPEYQPDNGDIGFLNNIKVIGTNTLYAQGGNYGKHSWLQGGMTGDTNAYMNLSNGLRYGLYADAHAIILAGGVWSNYLGTVRAVNDVTIEANIDLINARVVNSGSFAFYNGGQGPNSGGLPPISNVTAQFGELTGSGKLDGNTRPGVAWSIGSLGTTSTYSGVIVGSCSMSKVGVGTLMLGGTNTYSGRTAVSNGTLIVNGSLSTGSTSVAVASLIVNGSIAASSVSVAAGGSFTVNGTASNATVALDGAVTVNGLLGGDINGTTGSSIGGTGLILGSVTSDGAVSPGDMLGRLTIGGGIFVTGNGSLNIELGGTNGPGIDCDQLVVSNSAAFACTLNVALTNGFVPAVSNSFTILTAGAGVADAFSTMNLPALPAGLGWDYQNTGNALVLSVTSAPPASAGYDLYAQQITNGLTGNADDADGDGYANLLEYVTGGNPTNIDSVARMSATRNGGLLALKFTRDTNTVDATLVVEGSYGATNNASWNGIATNIAGSWGGATNVVESAGNPANVTAFDTVPAATNRFLRLRVTRP